MELIILAVVIVLPALWLYSLYVGVIKNKNAVREALSGIDVQLKKRHDLVPNILTIAKKFMEHENEIFTKVTELRTQAMNAPSGSKAKFAAQKHNTFIPKNNSLIYHQLLSSFCNCRMVSVHSLILLFSLSLRTILYSMMGDSLPSSRTSLICVSK